MGLRVTAPLVKALQVPMQVPVTGVALDALPQSCGKQWNLGEAQQLSVAIRGSRYLDVGDVDVSSLSLQGLAPAKWAYQDVSGPPKADTACPATDGVTDLHLLFDAAAAAARLETIANRSLRDGDTVVLTVTGRLRSGATFQGQDVLTVTTSTPPTRLEEASTPRLE